VKQAKVFKEKLFFVFASPAKIYRHKLNKVEKSTSKNEKSKLFIASVILILILLNTSLFAQAANPVLPTPKTKDLLFFLQRTPDANTVIYTINYKNDGTIDYKTPVKGSWIRYEENGAYKELTKIEKKFAYGVKCKSLGNDAYEIRLAAYQQMPLYMLKSVTDNKYHIYIKDEGKNLLLKRVFVRVNGGTFWLPKVEYIDLFTINSDSGIEMLKRINLGS
jgi:hypothetical protein